MKRVPLLTGTRVVLATVDDDALVLAAPAPGEAVADVGAAVRDALRFPLAGEPLEALVRPGGRATIVVEPPALPLPGSVHDPRQAAIAATVDELDRVGVATERQTLLVAGGLARRPGQAVIESLVSPDFARRFRGRVEVHDAEAPDLVQVGTVATTPLRVNPTLVDTDVAVVVSAAETVLHGGPATLLAASGPETQRAAGADSLLETGSSSGWDLAVALEGALSRRVPLIGASLVLHHPRLSGALRGFPYDPEAVERIARSPLRPLFGALPGRLRARVLRSLPLELTASAAFAGRPSVAHAEALLRAIEARSTTLEEPLDAICIGVPRATPYLPRERPNPVLAAYLGLGLALRLWRDAFPLVDGASAILVHHFHRHFSHPTQQPYRPLFHPSLALSDPEQVKAAERSAAVDEQAVAAYREGRTCHPLLPFADWDACAPALRRLGAVMIAGCRDSVAARQLGFVPTHGIGAALAMARGRSERRPRIGILLSPPYFPLKVAT
ncbi:MAG: DUF2088 domain-containing protein [Actinobacteria bacterium]|nr:DUF2088 domain-containing protein [Actinomycetota bacterium]